MFIMGYVKTARNSNEGVIKKKVRYSPANANLFSLKSILASSHSVQLLQRKPSVL